MPRPRRAAGRRAPLRARAPPARRVLPRLPVPRQAPGRADSVGRACPPGRPPGLAAARGVFDATRPMRSSSWSSTWSCSTKGGRLGGACRPPWPVSSGRPRSAVRELLSVDAVTAGMADQIARATAELHQKAHAFAVQLADTVAPTLLAEGRRVSLLPAARELRAAQSRSGHAEARHASRLLRRGLGDRLPPGRLAGRRLPRQGPDDEGTAREDVRAHPAGARTRSRARSSRAWNGSACPRRGCDAISMRVSAISSTSGSR